MKKLFFIFVFITHFYLHAQTKQFNNWHFTDHCGLTFNTNPPSIFYGAAINTDEGSSSISDTSGNTLFYTDGVTVWNKNNLAMPNGTGLFGHYSSTQSALIIPVPFSASQYYVFTTDAQAGTVGGSACGCLAYSMVDLSLQGGLGDVTTKNTVLHGQMTEKLTAYKHRNDTCIWLVSHQWNSDRFLSYLITPAGISAQPVISIAGSMHCCEPNNRNAIGQMKISPDGTKLSCVIDDQKVEFFRFDNSTGVVSDPITITSDPANDFTQIYGLEFSPNSRLAYTTSGPTLGDNIIVQFNLKTWSTSSIDASKTQIQGPLPNNYIFGQMQLAPDGKIYISNVSLYTLSVINNPDAIGSACNYVHLQTPTNGKLRSGLPNYMPGFLRTPPPVDSVACEDATVIPNIITPNGDGINDNFKIGCGDYSYLPEDLVLYNRWGEEVFRAGKSSNYDRLTDGTYFYIFSFKEKTYKGCLAVMR